MLTAGLAASAGLVVTRNFVLLSGLWWWRNRTVFHSSAPAPSRGTLAIIIKTTITMKNTILFFSFALLISCNIISQDKLTAEQIWSKYTEQIGDKSKIKELKGIRIKSVIKQNGQIINESELNSNNKDKLKMIIHNQSNEVIYILNGNNAVQVTNKNPRTLSDNETVDLKKTIDNFTEINYKEHGFNLELIGKELVEGSENYKIKFFKENSVVFYFINSKSFKVTKIEDAQGASYPSDIRNIEGINFFFKTKMVYNNNEFFQEIISIELNPSFDENFFKTE